MDLRINLLPPEIQARQQQKRNQQKLLFSGGLILVALVIVLGALITANTVTRTEVARLQEKRTALEQQAELYRPYAEMQARVVQTENLIQQAVGTPPDWAGVMTGIGMYIPPTVWLTDFTATWQPDGKTGDLVIKGQAYDHNSVAGWLEELRSMSGMNDVLCQFSSREGSGNDPVIRFEIKATLSPQSGVGKAGT